jgi:hypothetical protein
MPAIMIHAIEFFLGKVSKDCSGNLSKTIPRIKSKYHKN